MVWPIVAQVATRVGPPLLKAVKGYYKYEAKAFDYSYKGYSKWTKRGVIHGHIAGSVLGTFTSPSNYGPETPQRGSNKLGEKGGHMVQSKSKRRNYNNYSNYEGANAPKCKCGQRRRYR